MGVCLATILRNAGRELQFTRTLGFAKRTPIFHALECIHAHLCHTHVKKVLRNSLQREALHKLPQRLPIQARRLAAAVLNFPLCGDRIGGLK